VINDVARGALTKRGPSGIPRPRRPAPRRKSVWATVVLAIIAACFSYSHYKKTGSAADRPSQIPPRQTANPPSRDTTVERQTPSSPGDGGISKYFANRQSNMIVRAGGTVERILPDDSTTDDGSSRHQRFIVRLPGGVKVLVAHNIDLAERAPVTVGQTVTFKGEYEWTEEGGVIHWTHRDPKGRHPDGWIEVAGKKYE